MGYGNPQLADRKDFKTLFEGKRRGHSRKPVEFYDLLRRVAPGPRIDLFSREGHEGFDAWGNEVDKFTPSRDSASEPAA